MDTTLIVPGLHGSGHDHWQTWFERQIPDCIRVMQSDWSEPDLPKWSAKLRRELSRAPGRVYVVAHSFGCLAAVQAAFDYRESIDGLMLVAPADPARFGLSAAIPERPLGVPSVVIASTNDPWMSLAGALEWSQAWGAELINLGPAGHINPQSGYGPWPRGLSILQELRREQLEFVPEHVHGDEIYYQLGEF
jgi:predicted alpha/beta hydrolase family esterase